MEQPLTIVLPMYNRERQLRSSVQDILDMCTAMPRPIEIVIVDDGSTDDTYETACELVRQYPQVNAFRQSLRLGLGAALELVRNRLAVEMVLVHDGISQIDASQLQTLLQPGIGTDQTIEKAASPDMATESSGSRRFAAVRALHNQMEQAHRSATSFRWIQLEKPLVPRRRQSAVAPLAASQEMISPKGVVQLATLPTGISALPQS